MAGFPSRYVVFDTETNSSWVAGPVPTQELTLRLGVAIVVDAHPESIAPEYTFTFKESREFHDRLATLPYSKEPIYVYAHNMGFDARIVEFFRYLAMGQYGLMPPVSMAGSGRYKEPLFVGESPPFIVRLWRGDGQSLILLDTYQWFARALADVGESIGALKGKMPELTAPDHDWFTYCEQDCVVLHAALKRLWGFLGSLRLDRCEYTPASQAMLIYRMRFEKKRIIRPSDPEVLSLERLAYYGGQVEAFKLGVYEAPTYQLDVTSLYPHVMAENRYPCEIEEICDDPSRSRPDADFDPRVHTAEVWLESADWAYPVRGRSETLYCRGHVRTVLCGPELERAWCMGHVRYLGRWVRYRLEDLFSGYVSYLWSIRQNAKRRGDVFTDRLCKSMLNALHGKFGQRTGEWQSQGRDQPNGYFGSGKVIGESVAADTQYRVLAGHTYHRSRTHEDPRGFVPLASWTASYGRMYMADMRNLAGPDHVLYQATDSLLVDGDGLGQLQLAGMVQNGRLGALRHEETYPWISIKGVNCIDTDRKRVRPGVRKQAVEVASETYEQEDWESFSSGIFLGNVSSTFIRTIVKHIKMGCRRRRCVGDGTTEPWTIDNWHLSPEQQKLLPVREDRRTGE